MSTDSAPVNLTHHFLIAMPGMEDQTFAGSVVYLCEHSQRGALGLMINKPSDFSLAELFDRVDLPLKRGDLQAAEVLHGGPVQTDRGFVLHEPMLGVPQLDDATEPPKDQESGYASTMQIPGGLAMTTSRDVLEALADGVGPRKVLVMLGYSAWGEGQLESEIADNSWLTVGADPQVIFDTPLPERYDRALALLGLQAWMLSSEAGHA